MIRDVTSPPWSPSPSKERGKDIKKRGFAPLRYITRRVANLLLYKHASLVWLFSFVLVRNRIDS